MSHGRDVFRHSRYARNEARELLQSIFVAELLRPSEELWLVSPWLSDIDVIADSAGAFAAVMGGESNTSLSLSAALVHLAELKVRVHVVTRPTVSERFRSNLARHAERSSIGEQLTWMEVGNLHTKGLVGEDYRLMGSMNFTFNGIEINDEALRFDRDANSVTRARLQFEREYGQHGE